MATKIFCDRCNSTNRVTPFLWAAQQITLDLCSNCTRNLTEVIRQFIANKHLVPVSTSLDAALDEFVADKPKDIMK